MPNEISYNAAISAYEKAGHWQQVLNLPSLMPVEFAVPNDITYNAAISACEKGGQWQLALNLLSLMPVAGVVPNEITYNAAISGRICPCVGSGGACPGFHFAMLCSR